MDWRLSLTWLERVEDFFSPLFFHLLLQEWTKQLKWVKQCSPWTLLVLFDRCFSACSAETLLVVFSCFCSCLADGSWPSHFSVTVDLRETSEPLLSCPSSPLLFPAVFPLLPFWLVWPFRRFFSEVSLIPAKAGSSLSVDPPPPSLVCFLVLLTDFFSGLAGINRGDDGHDSTVPALETLETKWREKCFVGHIVFKLVHWNQGLGFMSKKCWWISFMK